MGKATSFLGGSGLTWRQSHRDHGGSDQLMSSATPISSCSSPMYVTIQASLVRVHEYLTSLTSILQRRTLPETNLHGDHKPWRGVLSVKPKGTAERRILVYSQRWYYDVSFENPENPQCNRTTLWTTPDEDARMPSFQSAVVVWSDHDCMRPLVLHSLARTSWRQPNRSMGKSRETTMAFYQIAITALPDTTRQQPCHPGQGRHQLVEIT